MAGFGLAPWIGAAFTAVAFFQLGLGLLPIDGKKDPTARLKGWAQLGAEVAGIAQRQGAAAILTANYASTGELAFYGPVDVPVHQAGERIRYANLPAPDEAALKRGPVLLIVSKRRGASRTAAFFASARLLTTVKREAELNPRDAYDVHLLEGYRADFSKNNDNRPGRPAARYRENGSWHAIRYNRLAAGRRVTGASRGSRADRHRTQL